MNAQTADPLPAPPLMALDRGPAHRDQVAVLAYQKWLQRGRPHGTELQDWLEAEAELRRLRDRATRAEDALRRARDEIARHGAERPAALPNVFTPDGRPADGAGADGALRQHYRILRTIVEGTTDAVYVKDPGGRYLLINSAGASFLGRPVAEILGRDDTELFSPDTARAIMARDREVMARGETRTFEDVGTSGGVTRTFLSTKGVCRDARGNVVALFGISRDITERKREEKLAHEREQELRVARSIQQGLLPRTPPVLPGVAVAGASHPAHETGGDYYDLFPLPGGCLGVAVGDASGKRVGAALLVAQTRAYLRAFTLAPSDVAEALALTNRCLAGDIAADYFVTLFLARLDPHGPSLVYSSAGHCPGYVLDRHGAVKARLDSTGTCLGVDAGSRFAAAPAVRLAAGDLVFLYTDGITEAFGEDGELFGTGRALAVVRGQRHRRPDQIIEALVREVRAFCGTAPQPDDLTAVVLKVEGAPAG